MRETPNSLVIESTKTPSTALNWYETIASRSSSSDQQRTGALAPASSWHARSSACPERPAGRLPSTSENTAFLVLATTGNFLLKVRTSTSLR